MSIQDTHCLFDPNFHGKGFNAHSKMNCHESWSATRSTKAAVRIDGRKIAKSDLCRRNISGDVRRLAPRLEEEGFFVHLESTTCAINLGAFVYIPTPLPLFSTKMEDYNPDGQISGEK